MRAKTFLTSATLAMGLALAACGTGATETDADMIDEQLLGEADNTDPALTAALEDQIMVDTDLAEQSNTNAALPNEPVSSAPVPDTLSASTSQMREAQAAISQGRLLRAPQPTSYTEEECGSCNSGRSAGRGETTLGALAEDQARNPQGGESCGAARVTYNLAFADQMPSAFRPYPNSEIMEAAGSNEGACRLRVVSFRSGADMQRLLDWYYTRAIRSGYSSEHVLRHGNNVLGGYRDRDEGAYYIIFAQRADGGTDVDIVSNNGR